MCDRLGELEGAMRRYAAGFDAALIRAVDAARVVELASTIEKIAATLKSLAAARVAETGLWRQHGDRSPAHGLARTTGSSVGEAARSLETGRRLRRLPRVAEAAKRGDLSSQQAAAITEAASADPAAETTLLDRAKRSSLQELKDHCARTKASADQDSESRRRRIHEGRYLRTYTDCEGAFNLHFRHNPEVGAEVMAAIEPIRDRLFHRSEEVGRHERLEACAADALVELARGGEAKEASSRPRGKILVRVDLGALVRGYPQGDEVAEVVGYGPVAVSAITDMMDSGDPFLAAIVTKGKDVVGVAHLGRRPNAHQQTALEWLYPSCAAQDCSARAGLQMDHRLDWADSHVTRLPLLDRLCEHHHYLKTHRGWALVEGRGKRAFVAPDDPRHPQRAARANAPPGAA